MEKRKYNKVLWCDRTPNGYWSFGLESSNGSLFTKVYIGYSKQEATRLVRRAVDQHDIIVNHPPAHRKSR